MSVDWFIYHCFNAALHSVILMLCQWSFNPNKLQSAAHFCLSHLKGHYGAVFTIKKLSNESSFDRF